MTMRVLLIRHGETAWNRQEIFRGREDIPLNENGIRQAEALAASVSNIEIAAVYSSPLSRATGTAAPLAGARDLPVRTEQDLIDLDFGEWQGHTLPEVEASHPGEFRVWRKTPHRASIPGGETLTEMRERCVSLLDRLYSTHSGEAIALVSHRVVTKVMLCHVLGLDNSAFFSLFQSNCCLNVFDMGPDGFVLRLLNDTCHLRNLDAVGSDF
jgi:probable phosphoglycerate mutase